MLKLNTFLKFVTCKCAFSSIQIKHFAKHIALWIMFQNVLVWEHPNFKILWNFTYQIKNQIIKRKK